MGIFLLPSTSALADYGEDLKKRDEIASQQNQPNSSSSTKYNPSVTTSSETTSPTGSSSTSSTYDKSNQGSTSSGEGSSSD